MTEKPVNGGLPYRSWDRMGRDLLLSFIALMTGTALTLLVSMGEKVQEMAIIQAELAKDNYFIEKRLTSHEMEEAHNGASKEISRLRSRVNILEDRQKR